MLRTIFLSMLCLTLSPSAFSQEKTEDQSRSRNEARQSAFDPFGGPGPRTDPFGGTTNDPFADPFNGVRTTVRLMLNGVDKKIIREWFNPFSMRQSGMASGGGMGGFSAGVPVPQNVSIDVDLASEVDVVEEPRVILIVPDGFTENDTQRFRQIMTPRAAAYGLDVAQGVRRVDGDQPPRSVLQVSIAAPDGLSIEFPRWDAVAKAIHPPLPVIEVTHRAREPELDGRGMDEMGMDEMMMGDIGMGEVKTESVIFDDDVFGTGDLKRTRSELADWQRKERETRATMQDLAQQHASDSRDQPRPAIENEIRRLLKSRGFIRKSIRQLRGRTIVLQATELMDEAEATYEREIQSQAIEAELQRLLQQ